MLNKLNTPADARILYLVILNYYANYNIILIKNIYQELVEQNRII